MKPWRQRLSGVHGWVGVLLGLLLFAIFWMGTLSVFDREFDRWMMPATRLPAPPVAPPLDALQPVVQSLVPADARQWRIDWATPRTPVLRLSWQSRASGRGQVLLDPRSLAILPESGTLGASGFFYPFHYGLMLDWADIGKWLVGSAAMSMLVLLVSGVVIHRKLLQEFFTFRPEKRLPRSSLDLHNLSGVLALPFHFAIALSGLVIFWALYFPQAHGSAYAGSQARAQLQADAYGRFQRPRAGPATVPMASLDAMAAQARTLWGEDAEPYFLRVWNPSDAAATVELRRSYAREVGMNLDQLFFDGASGRLLHRFEAAPAMGVQRFLSGLHFIQFQHPLLRWLYFGLGLTGCVLIATGLIHWLAARQGRAGGARPHAGFQALCIAGIAGLMLATTAYLAANKLLPAALPWSPAALSRPELELAVFLTVWLGSLLHARLRPVNAGHEQVLALSGLALACVALDLALTPITTAQHGPSGRAVWQIDILLCGLSAMAAYAAWVMGRRVGSRQA